MRQGKHSNGSVSVASKMSKETFGDGPHHSFSGTSGKEENYRSSFTAILLAYSTQDIAEFCQTCESCHFVKHVILARQHTTDGKNIT